MTVRELNDYFDEKYPKSTSCSWDNDGIMVCSDEDKEVKKVIVALDANYEVIDYAIEKGFDTVISHHPLIFSKMNCLVPKSAQYKRAMKALRNDISVLSYHTRLDIGENGVNDSIAHTLGYEVVKKLCIGDEMIASVIYLEKEMTVSEFAAFVKTKYSEKNVTCAVRYSCDKVIRKAALVGGAAKNFDKNDREYDVVLTGESSYNFTLDMAEDGLPVVEIGHYESEFPVCFEIERMIRSLGIECEVMMSKTHRNI